ncbi:MAG TPA: DUF4270 domain-containing protein [Bacteroidales bacterium]|nr:DUF4270 domain-containing protein [Bacteroidales bacterium]
MKNILSHPRLTLFLLLFVGFLTSCNKNEELGVNVQPSQDMLGINTVDIPVYAHTVYEDSVRTDETTYNLIGSYLDPVFGLTDAGVFTQFNLTTTSVPFGDNPVCDSVVLSLAYQGFYGDTSSMLTLNVFEISDDFYYDNTYYSDDILGTYKNNYAGITFKPNFKDSVQVGSIKYPPHLRVRLKNTLGQKFIDASGTSYLTDNASFLKFFKGLNISVKSVTSDGVMLYFNMLSSITKLTLYYHSDDDTAAYNFVIDSKTARFNTFDHKGFSTADPLFKQQLSGDTLLGDSILYVQAMAGTKIKLWIGYNDIVGLNAFLKDTVNGRIAINKATLVVKVDENTITEFAPPEKLILSKINSDGTLSFLADYAYGDAYYGGSYSSTAKEYRFNVAKHIQDAMLDDDFMDYGLYLVVSGAAVKSNRAVIKGNNTSQDNLRLEIIYTIID